VTVVAVTDLDRTQTCASCGQPFAVTRSDARYCSPACRQRSYRQRRVPVPDCQRVAELMRARIDGGEWPLRYRLPPEAELAESHQADPDTVAEAIGVLAGEGCLVVAEGGTYVIG
jgi:regulatory GntR family protein